MTALDPKIPPQIHNRNREIWKVLFQISEHLGEEWPQRCEDAARSFILGEHDETNAPMESPADELLKWTRAVFDPEEDALPSVEIVGRLLSLPGDHWWQREWQSASERAATMGLARQLGVHGIEHTKLRIGESTPWGYTRTDLGLPPVTVPADLDT